MAGLPFTPASLCTPQTRVMTGRHFHRLHLAIVLLAAMPATAMAQAADGDSGQIVSLTPEQKADVLDRGTEASVAAARAGIAQGGGDRQVHGEIGAMIGTGGARGIFGTAAIPLGDNAGAVVSFESSRYGRSRGY
jgi:hypothetical protein